MSWRTANILPYVVTKEKLHKTTTKFRDRLHSIDDHPAVVRDDGTKEWFCHGVRHRKNGPAYIHGTSVAIWYHWGMRHRYDAPALFTDDYEIYYQFDLKHRSDGPAVSYFDDRPDEYWFHGQQLTETEYALGTTR